MADVLDCVDFSMNHNKLKILLSSVFVSLILAGVVLGVLAYRGVYLGAENSPDNKYTLRYYRSHNYFKLFWSMPGGPACEPRWIRLYDGAETKLNELYTTSCALEMSVSWLDKQVILPDGSTIWELPDR